MEIDSPKGSPRRPSVDDVGLNGPLPPSDWKQKFLATVLEESNDESLCKLATDFQNSPVSNDGLNALFLSLLDANAQKSLKILLKNHSPGHIELQRSNFHTDAFLINLSEAMSHDSPVRSLTLSYMRLDSESIQALDTILDKARSLNKLKIANLELPESQIELLANTLSNACNLTELHLRNTHHRGNHGGMPNVRVEARLLAGALQHNPGLKLLVIDLTKESCSQIKSALKGTKSLETLEFHVIGESPEWSDVESLLGNLLAPNGKLTSLSIGFQSSGTRAVRNALWANSGQAGLGEAARGEPMDCGEFLGTCPLGSLDLTGATMTASEIGSLLRAVRGNTTLHTLKLPSLAIGLTVATGAVLAEELANMLAANPTVVHLGIPFGLTPNVVQGIAESLSQNKALLTLSYNWKWVNKELWGEIDARLVENRRAIHLNGMMALFAPMDEQDSMLGGSGDMVTYELFDMVTEMDPSIGRQLAMIHDLAQKKVDTPAQPDSSVTPQGEASEDQEPPTSSSPPTQSYPPT